MVYTWGHMSYFPSFFGGACLEKNEKNDSLGYQNSPSFSGYTPLHGIHPYMVYTPTWYTPLHGLSLSLISRVSLSYLAMTGESRCGSRWLSLDAEWFDPVTGQQLQLVHVWATHLSHCVIALSHWAWVSDCLESLSLSWENGVSGVYTCV